MHLISELLGSLDLTNPPNSFSLLESSKESLGIWKIVFRSKILGINKGKWVLRRLNSSLETLSKSSQVPLDDEMYFISYFQYQLYLIMVY